MTADNRTTMPRVAQFVDQMREVFGEGIRVTFASEGGQMKGRKGPEGIVPVIAVKVKGKK